MFKPWPKIPRVSNESFIVTEKIDGTNACIVIQTKTGNNKLPVPMPLAETYTHFIWAQSRTRMVYPECDNFGFAEWVRDNKETLIQELGAGYFYGEWWGKRIQRGYNLNERRFSLFNPNIVSSVCSAVPIIGTTDMEHLYKDLEEFASVLKDKGSLASPGFMKPEGLVIYAEQAKTHWKYIIDK